MDGEDLEEALYARMRWNTPLSEGHAGLLMDRLDLRPGARIADLGCGWGELLVQAVARATTASVTAGVTAAGATAAGATAADATAAGVTAGGATGQATGIGVDTDAAALGRARRLARERHLDHQIQFTEASAADWRGTADRVLCVAAAHAFGGTRPALAALAQVVPPGGRLLFGDGYWEGVPSAEATEIFGELLLRLPQFLEECRAAGWRVIHLSTADQREWDDFESTFRAGRQEWLLAHGDDPRATGVRDWLDTRERQYAGVYRQVLGFAYLILAH